MLKSALERRMLAISFFAAALLLLLFSRCSPLYPANTWSEANAFFTVGRSMLAGKVPYRDLVLGAGPVVFVLHALAALISGTSFLGVWLLEIVALTMLIFFSCRIALEISGMPVLSVAITGLMALLLVSSSAFIQGDTVEEFVLPLQAWAMHDLLICLKDPDRSLSSGKLVLHGFFAGCVFWMKYTMIGVHLAFIAVLAIDAMVYEQEMKGAAWMCLNFLAGAVFATAPLIGYLGANSALWELYNQYFNRDWLQLVNTIRPLRSSLAALAAGVIRDPVAALTMLCGGGYLLRRLVHRRWSAGCTAVTAAFACTVLIAFAEGQRPWYLGMSLGLFLMLCAAPLALLVRFAWKRRRIYIALLGCAAAACVGFVCFTNDNLPFIGYSREELPQVQFARHIEENGGGSLLVHGMKDSGFYLAAGQIPEFAVFTESEFNRGMDGRELKDYYVGATEWIISNEPYGLGLYVCAMEASSPYDRNSNRGNKIRTYYLCRHIDK